MRLLIVNNLFAPEFVGGYELVAEELAQRFITAGHEVAVATSPIVNHVGGGSAFAFRVYREFDYTGLRQDPATEEDWRIRGPFINLRNVSALRRILDDFRPDRVLLCNVAGLGALGLVLFLHHAGFKVPIYLGDNVFGGARTMDPPLFDRFCRLFDLGQALARVRLIAVSRRTLAEVQAELGFPFEETLRVPGWIDADLKRPLAAGGDAVRFVFASRIGSHKGIQFVPEAAALLLARGERRFTVDVFGAGEVPGMLHRIHAMGVDVHVAYRGLLDRAGMQQAFGGYDALLFPTWEREPLGLVPFEAAAQGCLPVVTAGIGATEWFVDGESCLTIARSAEALADVMQRLIRMPAAKRDALRRQAREAVRAWSSDTWFEQIEALLSDCASEVLPDSKALARTELALWAVTRLWRH